MFFTSTLVDAKTIINTFIMMFFKSTLVDAKKL